jgi:hypothetical protein
MIICSCNVLSDHEVRIAMATSKPPRTSRALSLSRLHCAMWALRPINQGDHGRTSASCQQHAHHRDLLARATAETQTHANSAKDQDRHLMITELMLDTCNYAQCPCWLRSTATSRRIGPTCCAAQLAVGQHQHGDLRHLDRRRSGERRLGGNQGASLRPGDLPAPADPAGIRLRERDGIAGPPPPVVCIENGHAIGPANHRFAIPVSQKALRRLFGLTGTSRTAPQAQHRNRRSARPSRLGSAERRPFCCQYGR